LSNQLLYPTRIGVSGLIWLQYSAVLTYNIGLQHALVSKLILVWKKNLKSRHFKRAICLTRWHPNSLNGLKYFKNSFLYVLHYTYKFCCLEIVDVFRNDATILLFRKIITFVACLQASKPTIGLFFFTYARAHRLPLWHGLKLLMGVHLTSQSPFLDNSDSHGLTNVDFYCGCYTS